MHAWQAIQETLGTAANTLKKVRIGWVVGILGLAMVALAFAHATPVDGMQTAEPKSTTVQVVTQPEAPKVTAPQGTTQPAAPSGVASIFGIDDAGRLIDSPTSLSLGLAAGVKWSRMEVDWSSLEPTPGHYNFYEADKSLKVLLNGGFSPITYISGNPSWAAKTGCGPIDVKNATILTAYGNAVYQFAKRYPQVQVWALYNEIDGTDTNRAGCFGSSKASGTAGNGVPDWQAYAIMSQTAWKAVQRANAETLSTAILAMGALAFDNFTTDSCPPNYGASNCHPSGFNYNFFPNVLTYMASHQLSGGDKYFDAVIFNFYDIYQSFWEAPKLPGNKGHGIIAKANALRGLMKSHGLPVLDLYVTETGDDSNAVSGGMTGQAHCTSIVMARGAAAALKGVIWWTFQDFKSPADWTYGLVDKNLTPKPSYNAMKTLASQLNGYTFSKDFTGKKAYVGAEVYRFQNGSSKKFYALSMTYTHGNDPGKNNYTSECTWARKAKKVSFKAKTVRMVDYLGNTTIIKDNTKQDKDKTKGMIAVKLTADPKIIELNPPQ